MTNPHPAFDWREAARLALTSRRIDELEEEDLSPGGEVTYQFSARGHELGQVLLCQLLGRPFDAASAYYRSRPFLLGLGLTIEEALASDMAKAGSLTAGRDVGVVSNMPNRGRGIVLPMAGDVGSQYTPAAGWAQAIRYRIQELGQKELDESLVIVFGGDGSVATNGFWSCLTMATTLKLPMLFVIEDNGYAISVRREMQTPGGNIAANLASFANLEIWSGSGTAPHETADLVFKSLNYVRDSGHPALLHLTVPRLSGHSSVDNQAYKSSETKSEESSRDPIPAMHSYLVPTLIDEDEWTRLQSEVHDNVMKALEGARSQAEPDPAQVSRFIFSEEGNPQKIGGLAPGTFSPLPGEPVKKPANPRRINMVDAIRLTLDNELRTNPMCLIFGEDVAVKGGVHTTTSGLVASHGPGRVFDTSLSEEGIIGRAVGMALAGLLPIPEIQFRKYADPAMEQLHNCGTIRWRTANFFAAPMVVRTAGGFGRKVGDPWHSVTSEVVFAHAPGWQVAVPSNAEDAAGLLRTALRGNDPVLYFEHRALLDAAWSRRPYPGDEYVIPFGKSRIILEGADISIITWGAMVERCQMVLEELGTSADLIDLRTLSPWDSRAVLESVRKTSKCLIVHEDGLLAGFGAEIAAVVAQEAFLDLDAPIMRVGAPSIPVPFNVDLMDAVVPNLALIRQNVQDLLAF